VTPSDPPRRPCYQPRYNVFQSTFRQQFWYLAGRYVIILDPGIKIEAGYKAYDEGIAQDIFVKDPGGVSSLVTEVKTPFTFRVFWKRNFALPLCLKK